MRLAIVATPALFSDHRPAPGALDGDLIRARLTLEDTGFQVEDLDPSRDLAEQLELIFERLAARAQPAPTGGPPLLLLYASTPVALSSEGELFLCLDPANPGVGDALAAIAAVFRDQARGRVLFVLECHHEPAPGDPFASAAIVEAAKQAVAPAVSGIELLVAAHPLDAARADMPSAFTRAFVEELDNADPDHGLTVRALYRRIQEGEQLAGVVPCYTYVRGHGDAPLLPARPGAAQPPEEDEGRSPEQDQDLRPTPVPGGDTDEPEPAAREPEPEPELPEHDAAEPEHPHEHHADASGDEHAHAHAHEDEALSSATLTDDLDAPTVDMTAAAAALVALERIQALEVTVDTSSLDSDTLALERIRDLEVTVDTSNLDDELPASPRFDRQPPEVAPPTPPEPAPSAPPPARSVPPAAPSAPGRSVPPIGIRSVPPPPLPGQSMPPPGWSAPPAPLPYGPAEHYIAQGDRHVAEKDLDGALGEYKKALAVLGLGQKRERAEVFVRIANVRWQQERRREAIASFEKALQLTPEHRPALEALIHLNVGEGDWRGVHAAEERFLASVERDDERFRHLVTFAERWQGVAGDEPRARATYERARAIRPDDLPVLGALRRLYESANAIEDAVQARRRIAEVTQDPSAKAREYFSLGQYLLEDLHDEDRGLPMLDLALESDPSLLEPLALIAQVLADRQEWGQLELAYRRMLNRILRIPSVAVRREVKWELCRRLGFLFRDHLEDPASALTAFEDALEARPDDLPTVLSALEVARAAGRLDRVAAHLQAAVVIDPAEVTLLHQLFGAFQKLRRPDQAWATASVTVDLGHADDRERIVYEEHRPEGVPRFARALRPTSWDLLRAADRDPHLEAILTAITEAAIDARIARRASDGTLAQLDPRARQDIQQSTVSVVRTFGWASHLLGVPAPAIYLREDAHLSLAAAMADHPAIIAGASVLRGRTMAELAFLVGRHLAYHVGPHRLLLYYPTIDDLGACFLAALSLVRPAIPIPPALEEDARDLAPELDARLYGSARDQLLAALESFEEAGARADLTHWAGAVERCATRAGYLLCGDLSIAAPLVRADTASLLSPEEKLGDLYAFTVSDAFHQLRRDLGIAIEP